MCSRTIPERKFRVKKHIPTVMFLFVAAVSCLGTSTFSPSHAADSAAPDGGYQPHITLTLPDGDNAGFQEQEAPPLKLTIRQENDPDEPDRTAQPSQPAIRIQGAHIPGQKVDAPGQTAKNYGTKQNHSQVDGPYQSGPYEISGVTVVDIHTGRVMPIHTVDLKPTIDRIAAGIQHSHPNDGSVFRNFSRKLPRKSRNYYREYVVPTKGVRGPGPQRLIIGERGEMYYTSDHYESFVTVEKD